MPGPLRRPRARSVVEVLVDEGRDALVEGRGEQQALPPGLRLVEDALHGLEEAEVAHVVGLIEHGDGDLAEVELALLDQVLDATGGFRR